MALLSIQNVRVAGVAAAVPRQVKDIPNLACFAPGEAEKVMALTGVRKARICPQGLCESDLCQAAAERLIEQLGWDRKDIDLLVFVSLSRDYVTPNTANLLQYKLGLEHECVSFDLPFACSGYVYGLSVAAAMMQTGNLKKGLLLVGETTSALQSPLDKTLYPLHGDGGTATALEFDDNAGALKFHLAGDGSGAEAIINPGGGARQPFDEKSLVMEEIAPGIVRNKLHSVIDGMGVFNFSMIRPPKSIKALEQHFGLNQDDVDYFLIHQANEYLITKIVKKIGADPKKVPYSLHEYGNVSSGTIPLTMVTQIREELQNQHLTLLGCGFGSGLSWGSVLFETDRIVVPELLEI